MPSPAFDVVGVGENSVDHVYRLPRFPDAWPSSKVPIAAASLSPGGQVTTALATCASLGLRTAYVGAFGHDDGSAAVQAALRSHGVNLDASVHRPVRGRYAVVLVEERSGERAILWQRDPALTIDPEELPAGMIRRARLLHVDAVDERLAIAAAAIAREAGALVTVDVDLATPRTRDLLALVTHPIMAEGVAEALTGETDAVRALLALRRSHDGWLCATLGARGAVLLAGDTLHAVPGHPVTAVDTTGAGDVFRGAFITALLRGEGPARVLQFANAAAAVSCTRDGAIAGVPAAAQIDQLLA